MGLLKEDKRKALLHAMAHMARQHRHSEQLVGIKRASCDPDGRGASRRTPSKDGDGDGDGDTPTGSGGPGKVTTLCMGDLELPMPLTVTLAPGPAAATAAPAAVRHGSSVQVKDRRSSGGDDSKNAGGGASPLGSSGSDEQRSEDERGDGESTDAGEASIVFAIALLKRLQQTAEGNDGVATVRRVELEQILEGFSRALESSSAALDQRDVEEELKKLFASHTNVFDEKVQNYIIQNFIQEVRMDCWLYHGEVSSDAMYPTEKGRPTGKWPRASPVSALSTTHRSLVDACPQMRNPDVMRVVQAKLANLSSWDFNVFEISDAAPGQAFTVVGSALLEKYDLCCHFRVSRRRVHEFLRQAQAKYLNNPYHNAEHAADVAQSLHHFFAVGNLGASFSHRTKCASILAALIHDMGHTSYSNNFHILLNDDLATQYVYRSPLEHMHCALAFQLLKAPECNILQGLTKIEQLEIRNLITDMVLATDNSVHSVYLSKLENLVRRSCDEDWKLTDPDDERLLLQMALHAADVSNPAKPLDLYVRWSERIMQEFYQQGDKERELQMAVSVGYDRNNPIPMEKMQAGFIIGIVRPLFNVLCQFPKVGLAHCVKQLDDNLIHWQNEIQRKQQV
ncbi:TPA: hypothetical protein N0F65_012807 [Lagenidium giganteum]|uniref:PDEase domain-containing protein n=1 Tax=Lagenidium giganteum TaxID=4803 RepID=A0AAV2YGM7_9STRA|nr:TPA: hypothetical protein N0F65_012807 [Lagenidium giganteum]